MLLSGSMTRRLGTQENPIASFRFFAVFALLGGGCSGACSGGAQPAAQTPAVTPTTQTTSTAAGSTTTVAATPTTTPTTAGGGWARRFGGPGNDWAGPLSTGAGGQILLSGHFEQTASFGGAPLTSSEAMSAFLASYSATGEHRWSQVGTGTRPLAFTAAGESSVLATGDDQRPAAIVSYSPTGSPSATSPLPPDSGWASLAVRGGDGALTVAGAFAKRVRVHRTSLTAVGADDVVVASLSAEGEPRWVRQIGSAGDDTVSGLAVDVAGNVYVAGSFTDGLTLGRHTVRSAGLADVYVTSFSPRGEPRWLVRMGDEHHDAPSDLVLDANGDAYVTGQIRRGGFYHGGRPTTYDDIFLASVSSGGEQRWLHRFETRTGSGEALEVHERQGLCLVGYFSGGVTFGSAALSVPEDPEIMNIPGGGEPSTDAFAACFSTAGDNRWAKRFGGLQADSARTLGVAEDGTMIVAGSFEGTADFDGQSLRSEGGADVFLLSLPPARQVPAPGN